MPKWPGEYGASDSDRTDYRSGKTEGPGCDGVQVCSGKKFPSELALFEKVLKGSADKRHRKGCVKEQVGTIHEINAPFRSQTKRIR